MVPDITHQPTRISTVIHYLIRPYSYALIPFFAMDHTTCCNLFECKCEIYKVGRSALHPSHKSTDIATNLISVFLPVVDYNNLSLTHQSTRRATVTLHYTLSYPPLPTHIRLLRLEIVHLGDSTAALGCKETGHYQSQSSNPLQAIFTAVVASATIEKFQVFSSEFQAPCTTVLQEYMIVRGVKS